MPSCSLMRIAVGPSHPYEFPATRQSYLPLVEFEYLSDLVGYLDLRATHTISFACIGGRSEQHSRERKPSGCPDVNALSAVGCITMYK